MKQGISQIGRCITCERPECTKPKAKQMYPENGCTDWETPRTKKFRYTPLIKVKPLKD